MDEEYTEPVPTVFEETRFARHKSHQCHYCCRWIDEEDYTRTAVARDTRHRRSFEVTIVCRDCRRAA